jgi:pimeloyl-ACP methyl ester carboxylesterase
MTQGKWRRRIGWALLGLIVLLAGAFLALRTPDTDRAAMIAKYSGPGDQFIALPGGARIHVRDSGRIGSADMAKPVMVLLHGSNSSLQTWEPLATRLQGQWRVVTMDLPGHGLTGAVPGDDYSVTSMVGAVDGVANALGLDPFVLGGNSMGGGVSWRYAVAHPARVRALVLLDAGGMPPRAGDAPPRSNIGFRIARNPVGSWLMQSITPRFMIRQSIEQTVANPAIVDEPMVDRYWEMLRFPGNRRATSLRFAQLFADPAAAETARTIRVPALIIFGKQDQIINPSAAQSFGERIAGSEVLMMDNIGHLPMEEAPDASARAISDFLQRRL